VAQNQEQDENNPTLSFLVEKGEEALESRDYADAKALFTTAVNIVNDDAAHNPYLIQRLAYATYKTKLPDPVTALSDAMKLLARLDLEHTNDTETVALAGRIEKKMYYHGLGDEHLSNAIQFYERGYFLLRNRYHGINLAFLFNKRVDSSLYNTKEDKIADMVFANRVRRQVLILCERDWKEINERKDRLELKAMVATFDKPADYNLTNETEQMYWILVNKAEAHYGLGEMEEYRQALEKAKEINPSDWMIKSFNDQHDQLRDLLIKYGNLLDPPWKEA
jgi:tetratricopeptide (TPR) repeat protein